MVRWLGFVVVGVLFSLFQNCGEMSSVKIAEQLEGASLTDLPVMSKVEDLEFYTFNNNPIEETNSLIILDPIVLNIFNREFDLGHLIGQFGAHQQGYKAPGTRLTPPGEYLDRTFAIMAAQQMDEANYYASNRDSVGRNNPVPEGRRMDHVLRMWEDIIDRRSPANADVDLADLTNLNDLRGGPFRLIAIVNRMDLAGDYDPRTQDEITRDPRSMGEIHLLYSLVDPNFEAQNNRAYPMVLALKYRLPVLNRSGSLHTIDDTFEAHRKVVLNQAPYVWQDKIQIWAQLWAGLSNFPRTDSRFIERLRTILQLSTRAQDFLALEANTQISDNEFELNSWYVFTGNRHLIPRSLRREPFRCMGGSPELAEMVNFFWKDEYNDLDMTTRNFAIGAGGLRDEEKAGYEVLRDDFRRFLSTRSKINPMIQAENQKVWNSEFCGNDNHLMPFRMKRSDDNENSGGRIFMITEATRIRGNGPLWGLGALTGPNRESKRHAFAIRTCSGCHSQEGAAKGFHVTPSRAGQPAKLSAFLTGKRERLREYFVDANQSNTFTFGTNNPVYEYNELYHRKVWLNDTLRRTAVLYESLKRPELKR